MIINLQKRQSIPYARNSRSKLSRLGTGEQNENHKNTQKESKMFNEDFLNNTGIWVLIAIVAVLLVVCGIGATVWVLIIALQSPVGVFRASAIGFLAAYIFVTVMLYKANKTMIKAEKEGGEQNETM